ncbi:helix-turn-helix domain-containing protein [Nocardia sp. NPDC050712]|uniref:helix-turn-helix domain-containing protein n=1 Tax=Nocardia sp. NPDC050712 TaxID=3155518 RepID=UPI0033FF2FA7
MTASVAIPPLPTLGDFVRVRRLRLGWSARELALEIPVAESYIRQIESGERTNPNDNILTRLNTLFHLRGDEQNHLLMLAGRPVTSTTTVPVPEEMLPRMLEALAPHAAGRVLDWKLTHANAQFRRLWPGLLEAPNMLHWWLGEQARAAHPAWEREIAVMVGLFRDYAARPGCQDSAAEILDSVKHLDHFWPLWQSGVVYSARPDPFRRVRPADEHREVLVQDTIMLWPQLHERPGILIMGIVHHEFT